MRTVHIAAALLLTLSRLSIAQSPNGTLPTLLKAGRVLDLRSGEYLTNQDGGRYRKLLETVKVLSEEDRKSLLDYENREAQTSPARVKRILKA